MSATENQTQGVEEQMQEAVTRLDEALKRCGYAGGTIRLSLNVTNHDFKPDFTLIVMPRYPLPEPVHCNFGGDMVGMCIKAMGLIEQWHQAEKE